jgi:hypothetical protein
MKLIAYNFSAWTAQNQYSQSSSIVASVTVEEIA